MVADAGSAVIAILGAVRRLRKLWVLCLTLGLFALALPAASLAGGSAGDQQYTDPFGGGGGSSATTSQTTTASAPPPTTAAAPPATTPADTTPVETTPATTPDATTAVSPTPDTGVVTTDPTGGSAGTLPYTGYPAWMAGGFGVVMLVSGLTLRRRSRTER
jgi:hypothetical protein